MPTEMRISVSENFKIDGGSVFCFSESKNWTVARPDKNKTALPHIQESPAHSMLAVSRQLAAVNGRLCRSVQSCGVRIAESEYLFTRILMD
jgi:hypothetical protein